MTDIEIRGRCDERFASVRDAFAAGFRERDEVGAAVGGSLAFADPERRLGFGYVMNRMGPRILLDDRAIALVEAANACLGGRT
jgi:CubicO group peptidase (beta-lactamase class C family)